MREKIGVILVNYNGKQYNDKCIESILKTTIKEQIHILVIDNASTDSSLEELTQHWGNHEQVQIIPLTKNYGFSKANNEGIRAALERGIEYFLLLNNDTEIESFTIERMIESQKQTGAIVVPKVFYADRPEIVWCAGGEFSPIIKKPRQTGLNQPDKPQFQVSRYCGFANGCCLLLTKDIIEKIGFLDEHFFLYYEDTEYSMRAKRKNIPIWYCADAVVYHKVNGSTQGNNNSDSVYYITRNWLMFNKIYNKTRILFYVYFVLNRLAWSIIWLLQGKKEMIGALLEGINDYLNDKYGKR